MVTQAQHGERLNEIETQGKITRLGMDNASKIYIAVVTTLGPIIAAIIVHFGK